MLGRSDNLGRLTLGAMLFAADNALAGAPPIPKVSGQVLVGCDEGGGVNYRLGVSGVEVDLD